MAKQFVVTAAELDQIIEGLELAKLRMQNYSTTSRGAEVEDMHRKFHFHVVRWVQDAAGHKGS